MLREVAERWDPIFTKPRGADFEEFRKRYASYKHPARCHIEELTAAKLKAAIEKMKETRAVAACGWRAVEMKDLPLNLLELYRKNWRLAILHIAGIDHNDTQSRGSRLNGNFGRPVGCPGC